MILKADVRLAVLLAAVCIAPATVVAESPDDTVTIALFSDDDQPQSFEVGGLTPEQIAHLERLDKADDAWPDLFAVSVGTADEPTQPPMLGSYSLTAGRLRFVPRFPLQPGRTYTAMLHVGRLAGDGATKTIRREFHLAAEPAAEPTTLVQVYPTRDVLPENLLKLYLHFSAPMSRGDSYRRMHLLDAAGAEIDLPFLEIGEELWNDAGTRLTVLFDPGRIKRGLKPREEDGPVLEEGKSYTLVVDREWPDAAGRPLQDGFRKTFQVGPPDARQPDQRRWNVTAPPAESREPLVVEFDEPLDHAMLRRVLTVRNDDGESIRGHVRIDRDETRWRFRPDRLWVTGSYRLVVETTLEDLAGNSIARPFEVDVFRPVERAVVDESVTVPFEIVTRRPIAAAQSANP